MIITLCSVCRKQDQAQFKHVNAECPYGMVICESCSQLTQENREDILNGRRNRNLERIMNYFHGLGWDMIQQFHAQQFLNNNIRIDDLDLE